MAKRNGLYKAAEDIEGIVFYAFKVGIQRSAEKIVKDLQARGPAWTGEFANSWEIASSSKVSGGTGSPGAPKPVKAPLLTNDEFKFKPEVKYYIANKAPHADYALDRIEGRFFVPKDQEQRNAAAAAGKTIETGSRPDTPHRRGDITGAGGGNATSSAPLDWYATYINGGEIDKTISVYMDQELRRAKR